MYVTNKHISRREVLRGAGIAIALPYMSAMVPAMKSTASLSEKPRLVCMEMVHGAAGCNVIGAKKHLWAPAVEGHDFDLSTSSLSPLEPFRDQITIVSNTDVRNAEAHSPPEIGGPHFRSSSVI